jgi:hypothetical protein
LKYDRKILTISKRSEEKEAINENSKIHQGNNMTIIKSWKPCGLLTWTLTFPATPKSSVMPALLTAADTAFTADWMLASS